MTFSCEYFTKENTNDCRSVQINSEIVWKIIIGSKYRLHDRLYRLHSQTKNRSDSLRHGIFFKTVAATVIARIISNTLDDHILFASHLTPDLSIQKSKNCVKNSQFKRAKPHHNRVEFNICGFWLTCFVTNENYFK